MDGNGKLRWTFDGAADAPEGVTRRSVSGLDINLDGKRILAGFTDDPGTEVAASVLYLLDDQPFKLWTVSIGGLLNDAAISDDSGQIAAASTDRNLYSLNGDGVVRWSFETPDVSGQQVNGAAVSPDGLRSTAGSQSGQVYLLNADGAQIFAIDADGPVNDVAITTSASRIAAGTAAGSIFLLNNQGAAVFQVPHPETSILAVAVNSGGTRLVAGSADGRVFYFDGQGTALWEVFLGGPVTSVAVSSSGNRVAASAGTTAYMLTGQGP